VHPFAPLELSEEPLDLYAVIDSKVLVLEQKPDSRSIHLIERGAIVRFLLMFKRPAQKLVVRAVGLPHFFLKPIHDG
jgi:hypothetical protein